jgi:hypothetical protein
MIDLRPCSACRRHVRVDASACPFCGAPAEAAQARSMPRGRLTRAAVFAAGTALAGAAAGCGGSEAADDQDGYETTGGGDTGGGGDVIVDDTGGGGDVEDTEDDYPPPDHDVAMPYGAPPARSRLV